MNDLDAKSQKKAAKAAHKFEKKGGTVPSAEPSPAERSAKAAEKQVRLQTVRVLLAFAAVVIAILSLARALQ